MTDLRTDRPTELPISLPSPAPDNPVEALEWLGGTVEEIVEGLRARGIKGQVWKVNSCPIAAYLREWFPDACVGMAIMYHADEACNYFMLSDQICNFISRFDHHEFPDLIAD